MHTKRAISPLSAIPSEAQYSERMPQLPLLPYHPILQGEDSVSLSSSRRGVIQSVERVSKKSFKNASLRSDGTKAIRSKNTCSSPRKRKIVDMRPVASEVAARDKLLSMTSSDGWSASKIKSFPLTGSSLHAGRKAKAILDETLNAAKGFGKTVSELKDSTNTMMCRTVSQEMIPPLVTLLEQYIEREVGVMQDDGSYLSIKRRLQPFRDAFFAFMHAFPVYGKILNDIMSAYDRAIQEQSETLADLISKRPENDLKEKEHDIAVAELNAIIEKMAEDRVNMRNSVEQTEGVSLNCDSEDVPSKLCSAKVAKTSSSWEKKYLEAKQKIKAMEEDSKADMERLLVLINAVRESDKRAKALELQIAALNAEVDELNVFKLMAGEAQMQLENFKIKYQNFISVQDHELIKEHLTQELQAAQHMARQYRRSAAVRGTQVDVIGRKLKVLKDENKKLLSEEVARQRELLTPRPDWKKIHASLQDVKENADPIEALPLDGDEAITSTVLGPSETTLQVDYLVERINSLSQELKRRSMVLMPIKSPTLLFVGRGVGDNVPVHLRACGVVPHVNMDPVEVLILVHDFFHDELQQHADVLLHTLDTPTLFLNFLRERIKKNARLSCFICAEHLAINLDEMGKDAERSRPSLRLLNGILSGSFPARVACDAITIVENVRSELKSLSEAQKRTRLRRTAISDCILPIMQLKTLEEIALLRECLGSDTTHDVTALCATGGKFMSLLFDQECASGMSFYVDVIEKLTSFSEYIKQDGGLLVINLDDVGRAIIEVEPLTPKPVIKEIVERSTEDLQEKETHTVRLDEIIHVLAAGPVIRRTARQKPEEAVL